MKVLNSESSYMKRIIIVIFLAILTLVAIKAHNDSYDLTLVGRWKWRDSMARTPIGIADCLKDDLKINFINVEPYHDLDLHDTPPQLVEIAAGTDKRAGKVALLVDHTWYRWNQPYTYVPDSDIKIAYSMIEATRLPEVAVNILNSRFDAVVVPDPWLIEVYRNSGVTKPIFVIPHGIYLDDFLNRPIKKKRHKTFTFGMSAGFWPWKNHIKVLKAFANEFKNREDVQLVMHGRNGDIDELKAFIKKEKVRNVKIIVKEFSQEEYISFLSKLDCYLFLSRGEGFSITPREAMAMGIPCILSNNTAHKTICNTGLVVPVEANIARPAYYDSFSSMCGVNFDCRIFDVVMALKEMYQNYKKYIGQAESARNWTKQYLYSNLRDSFLTLIKPKDVQIAQEDTIDNGVIRTTSQELYHKYHAFIVNKNEN